MEYKLLKGGVIRNSDKASIPDDENNKDWVRYTIWLAAGNTPDPQDPAPPPTQDELDATSAKQYAKLVALKNMTPAQVDAWVTANVNSMADAKDAIKTLAIAVGVLARRI